MKRCFKCGNTLPLDDFYRHPRMADGRLGKCKACTKTDVANRISRLKSDPAWVAQERARCRSKQLAYRMIGKATMSPGAQARWSIKYPEKRRAEQQARRALLAGRIQRKTSCEHCGYAGKLQMHHPDYSKPLEVVFLCTKCHGKAHWKDNQPQNPWHPRTH